MGTEPWRVAFDEGRFVDAVVELVRARDHVSFVEIQNLFKGAGMETRGNVIMLLERNVVMWAGVSDEFADILDAVRLEQPRRVWPHPSSPLVYLIDGGLLKFPIAKRIPKAGYKEPHWLPMTLSPHP